MPTRVQVALANTTITEPRALAEEADRFFLATQRPSPDLLAPTISAPPPVYRTAARDNSMPPDQRGATAGLCFYHSRFLCDTGAQRSVIPASEMDIMSREHGPQLATADGSPIRSYGFTSELWSAVAEGLGVKLHRTTAYHPQANGLCERFHRSMKAALRASLKDSNWLDKLPWVMLGLRTAPKEDLQSSSAELVYGQPLRVPGEFMPNTTDPWSAAAQRASLLDSARVFAPVPTTQHGVPTSKVPPGLRSAGYVFICHDAHRGPLQPPYDGPFRVLEHGPKHLVVDIGGRPEHVSVDRVKLAHLDVTQPVDLAIPPRRGRPGQPAPAEVPSTSAAPSLPLPPCHCFPPPRPAGGGRYYPAFPLTRLLWSQFNLPVATSQVKRTKPARTADVIQSIVDARQRVGIFFCHGIKMLVVDTETPAAIFFLYEYSGGRPWTVRWHNHSGGLTFGKGEPVGA
ncbi:hypothetical protein AAFF_G00119070 [Aldrovandia affinis]|uniref:Integrase catalytic domain-containing protein n=1 Tax=Aldrovandia affinis TaxID=143900 RepID=A0AAD7WA38_9TELE|nr:hypothetical protein AAFF_G00119070 [Aldrovandia affinis]